MRTIDKRGGGLALGVALVMMAGCNDGTPDAAGGAKSSAGATPARTAPPAARVEAPPGAPNVILISVDTLRPDHLGCYGYARATSPRIDALASEGALFVNAISSTSWTLPAHAALFTGLADSVHGCVDSGLRLDESRLTLAERLKERGYSTVGFFSGPYLHPVFGLAQGFDEYVDCSSYADLTMKTAATEGTVDTAAIETASHQDITNPRVTEEVLGWLRGDHDGPFFMFIHMWDVHADFIPPPPFDTMFDPGYDGPIDGVEPYQNDLIHEGMPQRDFDHWVALYDGEIAWTDRHVGQILDEVDARGLRENTIVVLTADHGTEFLEHGGKVHRRTLYDEVIRIPLMIRYPGKIPARRFGDQVRIIDIAPTLLHLAVDEVPTDFMGQPLTPLWKEGYLAADNLAISELFTAGRNGRAYRRNDRKLMINEDTGQIALYNLRDDPGEKRASGDVESAEPWIRGALADRDRGRQLLAQFQAMWPVQLARPDLPEHLKRQLESLGYIGGDAGEKEAPEGP